jgi:hypothetical protein
MGGPIGVDLKYAQECKAADMIKFLLAFCRSGDEQSDLVHEEEVLGRVFERARDIANGKEIALETGLSML